MPSRLNFCTRPDKCVGNQSTSLLGHQPVSTPVKQERPILTAKKWLAIARERLSVDTLSWPLEQFAVKDVRNILTLV